MHELDATDICPNVGGVECTAAPCLYLRYALAGAEELLGGGLPEWFVSELEPGFVSGFGVGPGEVAQLIGAVGGGLVHHFDDLFRLGVLLHLVLAEGPDRQLLTEIDEPSVSELPARTHQA